MDAKFFVYESCPRGWVPFGLARPFGVSIVGTGVDGPLPPRQSLLPGICYLRAVEDGGPYEFNLLVGFKQTCKLQFAKKQHRLRKGGGVAICGGNIRPSSSPTTPGA